MVGKKKLRPEELDYFLAAVAPVFIIGMIGSLVYFFITAIYEGEFRTRLMWILGLYTLAAVLISRIAIEQSRVLSNGYLLGLSLATLAVAPQFFVVQGVAAIFSFLILCGMLACVAWLADRITFDSTMIDDRSESSGIGILQSLGLIKSERRAFDKKRKRTSPENSQGTPQKQKNRKHTPGVWVLYFALLAIPMFGIGQFGIQNNVDRRSAFFYLSTYLFCSLSLLVLISLLSLRHYLREREVPMERGFAIRWLAIGVSCVALLVGFFSLLPIPAGALLSMKLPFTITNRDDLKANRWGWGNEGVQDDKLPPKAPPNANADAPPNANADGEAKNQNANGNPKPDGKGPTDKGPNGKGPNGKGPNGKGPNGKGPNGKESNADQEGSSNGEKGNESRSNQDDSNGESERPQQQNKQVNAPKQQRPADSPQNAEERNAEQREPNAEKGNGEKNADGKVPDGKKLDPQNQDNPKQNGQAKDAKEQEVQPPPPQPSSFSVQWDFANLLRWIVMAILLLVAVVYGIRYRSEIVKYFNGIWEWILNLFGGDRSIETIEASDEDLIVADPFPPFHSFSDPFAKGTGWPAEKQVRHLFLALKSWGHEHRVTCTEDETPDEFVHRLASRFAEQKETLLQVGRVVSRVAYARGTVHATELDSLRSLWNWLKNHESG